MKTYTEPSRAIPVAAEADVLVCGAGPAGVGAAIGAARAGCRDVLLVESGNAVGGVSTSGMMSHWTGETESPLLDEISRTQAESPLLPAEERGRVDRHICHEALKNAYLRLLGEAGVKVRLYTQVADAIVEGGRVRETRHFRALHTMTEEDIVEARQFDDWIATRNHFNFDIHNTMGAGLDANGAQKHFRAKGKYTIPYRSCVPEALDGLLLAGRCIGGTHKAHSNFRAMPICLNVWQGAGVAAAIAASRGILPRDVPAADIQAGLRRQGVAP